MPAVLLPDFSVFDRPRFYIGGDEQAVISCAQQWLDFADDCSRGAGLLVGAQPYGFVGSEGEAFNQHVGEAVPSQLQVASSVGEQVYAGIRTYAAGLGDAKTKMDAQRFTGMGCHTAVNTAAEAVNAAEAHLALAISTGNAAAISVAQANLKMCEVAYTQAVAEWEACLTGADTIKAELLEVTTRAAGQVTSVVKASTEGAVACVDPSGLSPYFQVVVWELEALADTADQVAELVASGMNQITPLVGADEISGDVITQAVDDTRSTWKYAAAKLMEDIERIGRQAVMFARLYAEHDQYATSLFDPITTMMRGMFRSILDHPADKVQPEYFDPDRLSAGSDSYVDAGNRSIFDPTLGRVVPMAQVITDMRMLRPGVQGPVDPKTLRRNTTRKTNTEAYLMANGQLPLPDGVTSTLIRPPATGSGGVDAVVRQSHASPLGNPYGFDNNGMPYTPGRAFGTYDPSHRTGDGTLIFDTPDGGHEKIFPRPPHGSTLQPYQSYQRWDPVTNTTTQQITYSNGMVVENTYTGRQASFTTPHAPYRVTNMLQPQTPLASTWQDVSSGSLNVQETPLSPVMSYHLSEPTITKEPLLIPRDIETAWNQGVNPAATAAGGASGGLDAIQKIDNLYAPEPSGIAAAQHIDEVAHFIKPLGMVGHVGNAVSFYNSYEDAKATDQLTPLIEAGGSIAGGSLGGMAGGALAGSVVAGPIGAIVGGAVGGIAGSELGKKLGHEIGEAIEDTAVGEFATEHLL
ncbi:hypothetical protein [Corynebacterium mustelae]|uniref:hypothetical protein n=1 Tax=Corynebacterium mustelae TaxID=571915 RepID=UPI00069CA8CE|nr:hypothetical protein [Corynebacterium mustelae]